ncbi:hypothetical protein BV20DRAFT_975207 [Pilatotrama ljubarskyi]|nr:hypothetical protein BV20DRAFT_975207 [Pilatotrama ljubarskyi]
MFASFSRFFLFALLAVPALSAGVPSPVPVAPSRVRRTVSDVEDYNPTGVVTRSIPLAGPEASLTNAQRLARGLPPRSPHLNVRRRALAARQSPAPCPQVTGTIQAKDLSGNVFAYVSRRPNAFGEYGKTDSAADALSVVVRTCDAPGPFGLQTLNGAADHTYLGAILGFASTSSTIDSSSFNYAYFGGTDLVPYGPATDSPNTFSSASGLAEPVESTIWTLGADNTLQVTWVNPDGSTPAEHLIYVPSSDAFTITGNVDLFAGNFGPVTEVTFTFVPNGSSASAP